MMNWLKGHESALIKTLQRKASSGVARRILEAPDFIYAAIIMRAGGLYHGRGDGTAILNQLFEEPSRDYKDILNKVALIMNRGLLKAPFWPELETKSHQTNMCYGAPDSSIFSVFQDRPGIEGGNLNGYDCHRLWAIYVDGFKMFTEIQLKNLCPEHVVKIDRWSGNKTNLARTMWPYYALSGKNYA